MVKLKTDDQVLYWDGASFLDLTKVVSVDKQKSQVKLANGIILNRTPDEDGVYHRGDYKQAFEEKQLKKRKKNRLPVSSAWKYDGTGETERIWNAYLFKRQFSNKYNSLKSKVEFTTIEDIIKNPETIEFLENVQQNLNKIKC